MGKSFRILVGIIGFCAVVALNVLLPIKFIRIGFTFSYLCFILGLYYGYHQELKSIANGLYKFSFIVFLGVIVLTIGWAQDWSGTKWRYSSILYIIFISAYILYKLNELGKKGKKKDEKEDEDLFDF